MNGRRTSGLLVLLVGLSLAASGARALLDVPFGLRVDYTVGLLGGATPDRTAVVEEIATERIARDWRGAVPQTFRARWYGYLTVLRPGTYHFATTSDDGSTLRVGSRLVVDNGGIRGTATKTGTVHLEPGAHLVVLEYLQAGLVYEMNWAWAREGGALAPVPSWRLTTERVPRWRVAGARALQWIAGVALAGAVGVLLAWAWRRHGAVQAAVIRRPRAAALALFILVAVANTWPLAADPGGHGRLDNGDMLLNAWAIAWVAHQLPRAPLQLFDANIFYPERDTLAYSEAMIAQSLMAAPLLWAGASPVLAYNIVLVAGFALTGWATSLVVARWTGSWTAGILSGLLLGVNAHTLTRMPHLQAQHAEFLPLALLALDRVLSAPQATHALRLALWFVLQALTSMYLLVFSAFALVAGALARPEDWLGRRARAVVPHLALSAVLAGILLAPILVPYWRVSSGQGLTRSLADAGWYTASLADYLTTPGRLHWTIWSHRWAGGTPLFPGVVALGLTGLAVASGVAMRDRRARMCVAIGICGVALSFGPRFPGYGVLYDVTPLLQAIRAPVRFGYLLIVSVALLAGFGLMELRRRVPPRAWRPAAAVALLMAVVEPFSAPLGFSPYFGIPAIYEQLRGEPGAVVAEVPLPDERSVFLNARYLLHSTAHWRPMLNGYSGFVPRSYREHAPLVRPFPAPGAIEALRRAGVTHVFAHRDRYGPDELTAMDEAPGLRKLAEDGSIALYSVVAGID